MAVLNFSVTQGLYDGDSSSATASKLNTNNYMWMYFTGVNIYPGATINSATLTLRVDGSPKSSNTFSHRFAMYDKDNATYPNTSSVTTDPRTSHSTTKSWVPNNFSDNSAVTVDLTSAVQEIINRAGWVSGNNICVLTTPVDTSTNLTFAAYEESGHNPPQFSIDYVANRPPTSNAGPDQTNVHTGDTVHLDGSSSSDPDAGDSLTYSWYVVDAGGTDLTNADISNASSAHASFIAPLPGSGVV